MNNMNSNAKQNSASLISNSMPDTINERIFSFLDDKSLISLSLTNKNSQNLTALTLKQRRISVEQAQKLLFDAAKEFQQSQEFPIKPEHQLQIEQSYKNLGYNRAFSIIYKGLNKNVLQTNAFIKLITASFSLQAKQSLLYIYANKRLTKKGNIERLKQSLVTSNLQDLALMSQRFVGKTKTQKVSTLFDILDKLGIFLVVKNTILKTGVSFKAKMCVNEEEIVTKGKILNPTIQKAKLLFKPYAIHLDMQVTPIPKKLKKFKPSENSYINTLLHYTSLYRQENTICCFAIDKFLDAQNQLEFDNTGISFFNGRAENKECCAFNLTADLEASTIAHELIHVLMLSSEHHESPSNIMYTDAGKSTFTSIKSKFSSKSKLDLEQLLIIKASKFCTLLK